jgi:hypothetical protein
MNTAEPGTIHVCEAGLLPGVLRDEGDPFFDILSSISVVRVLD